MILGIVLRAKYKCKMAFVCLLMTSELSVETLRADIEDVNRNISRGEGLISTIEAEVKYRQYPTPPQQLPRIEEAVRRLRQHTQSSKSPVFGQGYTVERFVMSADRARTKERYIHWWRKGARVRSDSSVESTSEQRVVVFDGVLVREITRTPDRSAGTINTVEGAHWNRAHREEAIDFLFQHNGIPFSTLLRDGKRICEYRDQVLGVPCIAIEIEHPKSNRVWFVVFTTADGIVRRFDVEMAVADEPRRLYERWDYVDYSVALDESGETIEYPKRVIQRACLGKLDDGEPVEYWTEEYVINKIEFNKDIPDEMFTLEFPPGTEIYDGVNGYGWVKEPEKIAAVVNFSPDPPSFWRRYAAAIGAAVGTLAAVAGWWWWRQRRARRAA